MYRSLATRGTLAAILATAVTTLACSGDQATTPVTPTSSSASRVASTTSSDESHGGGTGGGGDRGHNPGPGEAQAEVKGTIAAGSLSGSCTARNLSFMVGTTRVTTDAATRFDDTTCASLRAGSVVEAKGKRQPDNSILAARVEGRDDANDDDPNDDEVKGAIVAGSLTGSCAAGSLAFRIGTTAIRTNAMTQFDDITCSALGAGDVIEVHGTPQADGSLLASRIEPEE